MSKKYFIFSLLILFLACGQAAKSQEVSAAEKWPAFSLAEIDASLIGKTIEVSGKIIAKKGYDVYLDDGSGEIMIYCRTKNNIKPNLFNLGDDLKIIGKIEEAKNKIIKLSPLSPEAIIKTKRLKMPGEGIKTSWELEKNNKEKSAFKAWVLILTSGFVFAIIKLFQKNKLSN